MKYVYLDKDDKITCLLIDEIYDVDCGLGRLFIPDEYQQTYKLPYSCRADAFVDRNYSRAGVVN